MTPVRNSVERSDETSIRSVRSGRGTLTDLEAAASRAAMACSSVMERTRGSVIASPRDRKQDLEEPLVPLKRHFGDFHRDDDVRRGFGDDHGRGHAVIGVQVGWHLCVLPLAAAEHGADANAERLKHDEYGLSG